MDTRTHANILDLEPRLKWGRWWRLYCETAGFVLLGYAISGSTGWLFDRLFDWWLP